MKTIYKIGKNEENDIVIKDKSCLDFQCEIIYKKGYWLLKNLDDRNPVFLNDKKLEEATHLDKNDIIKIGKKKIYWSNYLFEGELQEFDMGTIFSFNGRLSRSNFRALTVLALGLAVCVFFSPGLFGTAHQNRNLEIDSVNTTSEIAPYIYLIGFSIIGLALFMLSIKRMRDTRNPLWKIFIPFYNLKILYFEESKK